MLKVLTEKLRSAKIDLSPVQGILDKTLLKLKDIKFDTICSLTAVSYGILFFSVVNAAHIDIGYRVMVNDICYGTVATKKEAQAVLSEALNEITSAKEDFSYSKAGCFFSVNTASNIKTPEFVKNEIVADLDGLTFAYGVSVDGNIVTALENEQDAQNIVQEILSGYKTETNEVQYVNKVEVSGTRVRNGLIMNIDEAKAVLNGSREEAVTHIVKSVDTFSQIAENYNISSQALMDNNGGVTPEKLQIGQELTVSASVPLLSVQTTEQITVNERIPYEVTEKQDSSMYKGIRKVISSGVYGEKTVVYNVKKVNNSVTEKIPVSETVISNPVTEIVAVGTKIKPKEAPTGSFIRPYYGSITSRFGSRWGRNHNGIDYGGRVGDPIKAADGGTVTYAGWYSGYGNFIKINHGNGKETYYGHLSSISVKNGQKVAQGAVIGKVGNTGNSTGPHLHFEIRINGKAVDPSKYLK